MKHFKTLLLLSLVCLVSVSAFGQRKKSSKRHSDQVYTGYVIMANSNDTLFGKVEFLNPTYNQETVVFFKDGEKTEYHTAQGEISEYAFEYKRYNKETKSTESLWFVYVSKRIQGEDKSTIKAYFMERQVDGEITLYNFFSLETSRINSREYNHNYFAEKKGLYGFDLVMITRDNYRTTIREYLVLGNDAIESNLGTSGYGYKYLSSIVEVQNAWLTGNPRYDILLSSINSMDLN
jgi:hypothetical protein